MVNSILQVAGQIKPSWKLHFWRVKVQVRRLLSVRVWFYSDAGSSRRQNEPQPAASPFFPAKPTFKLRKNP
jgi:hypothetical protein